MKKIILCLMFVLAMCASVMAEECVNFEKLSKNRYMSKQVVQTENTVEMQGLFGVTDENGDVILPFEYYDINSNENGTLFAVKKEKDGLYGIVDENNNVVTDFKYEYAFAGFKASFYGIVNRGGRKICYKIADGKEYLYYSDVMYKITDREISYSDESTKSSDGEDLPSENYSECTIFAGKEALTTGNGITDSNGNVIVPFEFNGNIRVLERGKLYGVKKSHDGLFGLYDSKAGLITPFKYNEVVRSGGECYGRIYNSEMDLFDNYKLTNGKETFENHAFWYADVDAEDRYFSRGQLASPDNSTVPPFGIVDCIGRIILPFEYNDIEELKDGEWYVVNKTKDGLYGVVDENNEQVADYKYYDVVEIDDIVYGMIENNGKVDYYKIDSGGENYYKTLDGYIFRGEGGETGYYEKRTDKVDYPLLSKKYGLVDSELNIIVKPLYDNQIVFKGGNYANVYRGSTYASVEGGIYTYVVYSGGELVHLKKDGNKIVEVEDKDLPTIQNKPEEGEDKDEPAIQYGHEERVVIEPISTPDVRKQLAVLKAIEAVAIAVAIGCVWWLVRYADKKRKKCD